MGNIVRVISLNGFNARQTLEALYQGFKFFPIMHIKLDIAFEENNKMNFAFIMEFKLECKEGRCQRRMLQVNSPLRGP